MGRNLPVIKENWHCLNSFSLFQLFMWQKYSTLSGTYPWITLWGLKTPLSLPPPSPLQCLQCQYTLLLTLTNWRKKLNLLKQQLKMRSYLQRYWWSNNPAIWLDKRHNWPHLTKSGTLRWYLPLVSIFIQKNKDHLILSTDTHAHQRILQSDYTKGTSGHPQPKQAVSHPALPWWSSPYKKCKRWIDSFQRYWW